MRTEDEAWVLSFNGEIYNFQELRAQIEATGHRFRSQSDTEVLLELWRREGRACLSKLRGMFAFAVYDKKTRTLTLARDRVGKKPLFYFRQGNVFAFASEIKALRTLSNAPRSVDWESIHHFLTMMYLPSPLTGTEGMLKLPAAHTLTLDLSTGEIQIERYWELRYDTDTVTSLPVWKEKIANAFEESVRLRMVADVPVGAFLSGGIDSAAVVASMSKHGSQPVKTFSIGTRHQTHNELPDALRIAQLFQTDHHPIEVEADIVHLLPELVRTYEQPYGDSSAIPTYLIAREARKVVTVALNGDGGDENFAGYVRYPILRFSEGWRRAPALLHRLTRGGTYLFHSLMRSTFSYRVNRFQQSMPLPWEQRYLQYLSFFTEEEKRRLYRDGFGDNFSRTDQWYAVRTTDARNRAGDLVHRAMSMDIETYLAEDLLPKVDYGTMAHGLEARSPFLDHTLLELTARLPIHYQLHGSVRKWILKEVLKDTLPLATLSRPKTGFRLPLDTWFRRDLSSFVSERLLEGHQNMWQVFDRSRLEAFLAEYRRSHIDYSDHIWALLWLQEWFSQYTDA